MGRDYTEPTHAKKWMKGFMHQIAEVYINQIQPLR